MACRQCQGLESLFDNKTATKELKVYRKKGPGKTTQLLIDALKAEGVDDLSLLDIGGGVGAIQHELMKAGASTVTNVDASSAYIAVAKDEAAQQGYIHRASYHFGDFVDLAPKHSLADIVTLDRSICCYPNVSALVGLSAQRARKLYGVVYPRDTWWLKMGVSIINFISKIFWKDYRFFIHPTTTVENIISKNGLKRRFYQKTFFWQVAVYSR